MSSVIYWLLGGAIAALVVVLVVSRKRDPREEVAGAPAAPSAPAPGVDRGVPFMEHPSGEHETAVDAMADAVARLRKLEGWDRWITFCAQGQGTVVGSYHFAELKLLGDRIDAGDAVVDAGSALPAAGLDPARLEIARTPEGHFVLRGFTPRQVAAFLDAVFRGQLGIRPHEGEGDDYAVGAEW